MQIFVSGFLLSLSLCLDLGIVNVATIKTGLERGFWPALLMGVGSSFGDLVYAVASMVGISFLVQHAYVRWILWIGGTLVLCYLAVHMFSEVLRPKQLKTADAPSSTERRSLGGAFLAGMGLALASPSAILWFATVGGSVIAGAYGKGTHQAAVWTFLLGFLCAGLVWSLFIAFVSGQIRTVLGPRFLRLLSLVSAILFVYFAIHVFLAGYHTLL